MMQVAEDFAAMQKQQRFARLTHLLEKSSLYTDFLYQRMQQQKVGAGFHDAPLNSGRPFSHSNERFTLPQAEAAKREARKRKPREKEAATAPTTADHNVKNISCRRDESSQDFTPPGLSFTAPPQIRGGHHFRGTRLAQGQARLLRGQEEGDGQ